MEWPLEASFKSNKSRRRALILTTAGAASLFMPRVPVATAAETAWPNIRSRKDLWYPHWEGVGLPTLYAKNGSLDFYDQSTGNTNVREYYEDLAHRLLDQSQRSSWNSLGLCNGSANANFGLSYLEALGQGNGGISTEQSNRIFYNDHLYGLWVALRMADVQGRPSIDNQQANKSYLLDEMDIKQRAFVGSIDRGIPGDWWYFITGKYGSTLTATGFGETKGFHSSQLKDAYFPIPIEEFSTYPNLNPAMKDEYYFLRLSEHGIGFNPQIVRELLGLS